MYYEGWGREGYITDRDAPYIDGGEVAATSVWSASDGIKLKNGDYYMVKNNSNALTLSTSAANGDWTWDGANNRLYIATNSSTYYLRFIYDYFGLHTKVNSVYLFEKTDIHTEIDPYEASEIQLLSADELNLYKGNTADLSAQVLPLTAEDRTVDWSSSNSAVATVDESGRVTAVGAGSAVITAAAHSNPSLIAQCKVKVVSINKNLNSIIWDEAGGVYFSRFNANSLPAWTKLHDDAEGQQLASAFMQSSSNLYAATLDASSAETVLYTVNRNSYAMTEYGVNYLWATDMAIAATTYASYVGMAYTFGTYLVAGPIAPGDDGEGGTYCGLPYAADDFSETTGGAYFAGIACESRSSAGGTFFVLDENGVIWKSTLGLNSNSFEFSELEMVVDTGVSTSFLYQNLYYDGTYLYWGHTADNIAELIIINPDTGAIYHAGNFGEGVWPVTGMYVDGSVAPAGTGDETMGAELPADLTHVATRAELMTDEVMARFTAEAARFGVTGDSGEFAAEPDQDSNETETVELEEEPAVYELPVEDLEEPVVDLLPVEPELPGEYDSVPGTPDGARFRRSSLRGAEAGAPQGETVTVTLSEDEDAANGVIELVFDPQYLTFVSAEAADSEVYYSCNSAQSGLVRLAYARKSAGAVSFSVAFTDLCDDSGLTVTTTQRDANLALEETEELCRVVVTDHNTGAAETLSGKAFYTVGETVAFTVSADKACLAAVRAADGSYTVLTSADPGTGSYSFTVEGKCAVELVYKGDVNADGRISAVDAILAKRAAVGRFTPEGLALAAGDLNGDGSLTTADAFLIARAAIRLQTIDW